MAKQLTIRLSDELAELLEKRARRMRRKRSELVRIALEDYLDAGSEEKRKTLYERAM
jgi:predicted transcriptional regulator